MSPIRVDSSFCNKNIRVIFRHQISYLAIKAFLARPSNILTYYSRGTVIWKHFLVQIAQYMIPANNKLAKQTSCGISNGLFQFYSIAY